MSYRRYPPNHRRLAENDTLVELIQTAEYLEDAPSWEQRRFYPLQYGDPYYRGCGRGHGRGRGRGRGWLSEDVTERDTGGGQGRFYSHGNGRNDHDRNGFPPTSRRDIRLEMPPELEPSRFTDWSSIASPPARTSPHGVPDVQPTQNQLNVPAATGTRQERDEVGISEGVALVPQMDVLREDQGIQARSSPHTEDVMTSAPQGSSTNDDHPRCSQLRSHTIEGMSSIRPVDSSITNGIRQIALDDGGHGPPRTSTINRRDSSDSSDTDRIPRRRRYPNERGRPPERDRYSSRDRRPPR